MALPLQPSLSPWSAAARRLAMLGAALAALIGLGLVAPARAAPARVVLSGPGHSMEYARVARRLIDGAGARVRLVMFVMRIDDGPAHELAEALAGAARRGVDVRVCLDYGRSFESDDIDDKHVAPAAWLRAHGVRVVLDELERTTHAKVLVVDGRRALVGSHNWTASALTRNREASILVDDPDAAEELERGLVATIPGMD